MIKRINFHKLNLPLKKPYHLSFGEVRHFDTFIVSIHDGSGTGLGESTPLPGYSSETPEDVWAFGREIAPRLIGKGPEAAREILSPFIKSLPFAVTPFLTALEGLSGWLDTPLHDVELVGILSSGDHGEIKKELPEIVDRGFKTIKVKVGMGDVDDEIDRVNLIMSIKPDDVIIRVDANQGYNYDQAARFVRGVDPDGIELFEQPFPKGVWDEMERLARISPIPLMLDESINTEEDLKRVIQLKCASYVKFKLMKAGSVENLARLINMAGESGLKVVMGNGVAGEIGCWHEALAAVRVGLTCAGEMNGFLKIVEPILVCPLRFESGRIKGDGPLRPELDYAILNKYLGGEAVWES